MATFREEPLARLTLCFCVYIIAISRFGFEGRIWVLIATVTGHCLLLASSKDTNFIAM